MKNLYNEFFQVPEKGKIREKVLFAHITVTVVSIIICLIAMSVTAYAYFTSTVSSGTNLVKTAKYTLSVSAVNKDTDQPVTFTLDGNNYSAPLEAGTYVFTLTPTGTATNGFSVVEINGDTYHTVQIEKTPFTFEIVFKNYSVIEFIPHWGTSSHYDAYKNGDTDPYYIEKNITVETTAASAPLTEPTPTATPTPTPEITPEITPEATATSTPEVTATPTVAPSTATPTATPILTPEVTPTLAPEVTPTLTPEATPTATAVPTATAEPTLTPASEATPTPTPEDITE